MVNIQQLCNDGYKVENANVDSITFLSLEIALKSYFSTYKSIASNGSSFLRVSTDPNDLASKKYIEYYSETIVHFQHFFELICKDILRNEHELLVLNMDNKHELLYKLLFNESV